MRAPLSWIREFAEIPQSCGPDEIANALVRVGFEVEEIVHQGVELSGPIVVARVIAIEELTDFKKPIRWVELDCGQADSRFVICGAKNFNVGDLVVAALPGANLPGGFAIGQRETYGKVSDGMICSSRELGLSEDHSGILVLPAECAAPGNDALALLEINDVIFDIAVNPDRGYALSLRGIAREVAAALAINYSDPALSIRTEGLTSSGKGVVPKIESGASVIYIRTLDDFDPRSTTPLWMRRRLEKCGMRSISLAVDVTNYVMLELGQPLHAFDREKIHGTLRIRKAGKNATFTTLDGQKRELFPDDLLVADDDEALALAGTMGGESSEVGAQTHALAIEAARFDPVAIARNSRRHKLSTEASRRFERGVDPSLAELASARAALLLMQYGGAQHVDSQSDGSAVFASAVDFDPTYAATLTGADISLDQVRSALVVIGCNVKEINQRLWRIEPPSWRSDLQGPADLVEEVARMVGYDAIPSVLPPHPVSPGLTIFQRRLRVVAQVLADKGLVEVQTYPFMSESTIELLGYKGDRARTFRIANPISEEAPLLRMHLIPGLLQAAAMNLGRGARDFGIFEIGSVFQNLHPSVAVENPTSDKRPTSEQIEAIYSSVPAQPIHAGGVLIGKATSDDWRGAGRNYDWNDAIEMAESILSACGIEWTVNGSEFAPWHPGRCAEILVEGRVIAHAGELHPRVVAAYGLPARACAFVVNLSRIPEHASIAAPFVGTMPVAVQDIALIVDSTVSNAEIIEALKAGGGPYLESVALFDRYDKLGDGKISMAYTLSFRAPDRTLTGAEIAKLRESAVEQARERLGATLRSA